MSKFKSLVLPTLVLVAICLVATAALALTNTVTAPLIEQAAIEAANAARSVVLPEGDSFTEVTDYTTENVIEVYKADNDSGYTVTATAKGYNGELHVMTGIKADGTIAGVQVMLNNETPGLGSRVSDEEYTAQYPGKSDLEGVDVIAGATISSIAFENCVNTAFEVFAELSGTATPGEGTDNPMAAFFPDADLIAIELDGAVEAYRAGSVGYVVAVQADGYGETPMQVIVAVGGDGNIVGVALGENSETDGLGTQVGESDYTSRFVGKTSTDIDGIDIISGATVSAEGFKAGVKTALELITPDMLAELQGSADSTTPASSFFPGAELTLIELDGAVEAYRAEGTGYLMTVETDGYSRNGPMQVVVAVGADGNVIGVELGSNSETDGLGTQVGESDYTSQFLGKTATEVDDIAVISGATVSSVGFKNGVKTALELITDDMLGELQGSADSTAPASSFFPGAELTLIELGGAVEAYRAEGTGYLVTVETDGYSKKGPMQVVVAVGADGNVIGVELGSNSETDGLGTQVGESDYTSRFVGKTSTDIDGIDIISGATVSSVGFKNGVKTALELITPDMLAELSSGGGGGE